MDFRTQPLWLWTGIHRKSRAAWTLFRVSSFFALLRESKDLIAACRWHVAATSSKTGGYLYFLQRRKCKRFPYGSLQTWAFLQIVLHIHKLPQLNPKPLKIQLHFSEKCATISGGKLRNYERRTGNTLILLFSEHRKKKGSFINGK